MRAAWELGAPLPAQGAWYGEHGALWSWGGAGWAEGTSSRSLRVNLAMAAIVVV